MKRAFAVLSLLSTFLLAVPAGAEWVTKEVKWQISNRGGPGDGTGIWVRDTTHAVIASVSADTTNEFTLNDACIPPRGFVAPGITEQGAVTASAFAYNSDSTVVAWLVAQCDSSAAPAATIKGATAFFDGKVGAFGGNVNLARGWVKADSALVNSAGGYIVGEESIAWPIRTISPYGATLRWDTFRARIEGASSAGTVLSAVRVFIRYWKCN